MSLPTTSPVEPTGPRPGPPAGIARGVLIAGAVFVVTAAGSFAMSAVNSSVPPSFALLMCWPAFAVAAGVLLDLGDRDQLDTRPLALVALCLAALGPALATWSRLRTGGGLDAGLLSMLRPIGPLLAVGVGFGLSWGLQPRSARTRLLPWAALGLVGAVLAALVDSGAGWAVVVVAWLGHVASTAWHTDVDLRQARRRHAWGLGAISLCCVVVAVADGLLRETVADTVSGLSVVVLALAVTRLAFQSDFRPLRDLVLDLAVALGAVASALAVAGIVRIGVISTPLRSPDTFAAFAGLVTLALVVPAAVSLRRTLLARRYGSGSLSPDDVALITADLHTLADPRDLLDNAARMVAASSGSSAVRILLGAASESVSHPWTEHPLVVGGDRVGTLLVQASGSGDLEPPQRRVVAQLLPTVALVTRAVTLAVEAEHARSDVARQRDAERRRILADLHDGVGPVLAGMSMRVGAALRRTTGEESALLVDLSEDLASCRTDLRRIVAGITPSVLDGANLQDALTRLVRSFGDAGAGPEVSLELAMLADPPLPQQVTLYRCVAEGITNALRHARPAHITVRVRADATRSHVEVVDDGSGGPVVPGVGLSSLRQRAEDAGGWLRVGPAPGAGTSLQLELPATGLVLETVGVAP